MYTNIILFVLIILFIGIIFIEFTKQINTTTYESFQEELTTSGAPKTLEEELEKKYQTFLDFYTNFCVSWNKAIVTLSVSNTPQQPLKSPSDVSTSGNAPEPSNEDLMLNIRLLEKQLGQPLPSTCVDFPQTITKENIDSIISIFPSDSVPYMNALTWMNKHMSDAHDSLNKALTTNPLEGFESQEISLDCKNIEKCTKENETQKQKELIQLINNFFSNKDQLSQLMEENTKLVEKSNKIQQQAQSGELYKQVNVKDTSYYSKPTMPEGGDNLKKLQNTNPQRYDELKQNYSQWFNIKTMIEQINNTIT
jgi:hypothetical protein